MFLFTGPFSNQAQVDTLALLGVKSSQVICLRSAQVVGGCTPAEPLPQHLLRRCWLVGRIHKLSYRNFKADFPTSTSGWLIQTFHLFASKLCRFFDTPQGACSKSMTRAKPGVEAPAVPEPKEPSRMCTCVVTCCIFVQHVCLDVSYRRFIWEVFSSLKITLPMAQGDISSKPNGRRKASS